MIKVNTSKGALVFHEMDALRPDMVLQIKSICPKTKIAVCQYVHPDSDDRDRDVHASLSRLFLPKNHPSFTGRERKRGVK